MTQSKPTAPPKVPSPPKLPDTKELIEPLRKLLDYLDYDLNGDWDEIPQYAALEKLLLQYPRVIENLVWSAEIAVAEKEYGPWPRFEKAPHPLCIELDSDIEELKELAEKGGGHNDELRYQQARNRLLEDPEVAARAPASLKAAVSLRAFQEQINLLMGDCTNVESKHHVVYDEFRNLSDWLGGRLVHGSPEWIAHETWFVKTRLVKTFWIMSSMRQIRDAVVARVPDREKREHWARFVEREFMAEPFMAHALVIAGEAWDAVFFRHALAEKQKKLAMAGNDHPTKRKSSKKAPRR